MFFENLLDTTEGAVFSRSTAALAGALAGGRDLAGHEVSRY